MNINGSHKTRSNPALAIAIALILAPVATMVLEIPLFGIGWLMDFMDLSVKIKRIVAITWTLMSFGGGVYIFIKVFRLINGWLES